MKIRKGTHKTQVKTNTEGGRERERESIKWIETDRELNKPLKISNKYGIKWKETEMETW